MGNDSFLINMGIRIAGRRKDLHLTQEQLAEKMGVSLQTVSCIELGKKAIRPQNLANLCVHLEVTADYILYGKRNEEQMKDEEFTGLLTRSNSTASLDAIFANCDKKGKATKKEERINLANVEFKLQLSGLDENKKEEFFIDNLKNDLLGKKRKFESS